MPLYTQLPGDFAAARESLDRMAKVNATLLRSQQGTRRQPDPPRSLIAQAASMGAVITWNAPVRMKGVVGFRIYKDTDVAIYEEIRDPGRRQVKVALPANTTTLFYVSTITGQNAESPRIPVTVSSTTDQLVTSGTAGATPGSVPSPPPNWDREPTGGNRFFAQL